MPFIGLPFSFLENLSDFWQRFFADADQLESLYQGTAVLMGQAYLDLLAGVLNVSLRDVPVFNKEYFRLVTLREDEVRYVAGATTAEDRWAYALPTDLISFQSLDNKVIEPTASLQERNDYALDEGRVLFLADPTDPAQAGAPLPGYARRTLDVVFGGTLDDTTRSAWTMPSWIAQGVRKGDTLRLLDVGPALIDPAQRRVSDHVITLVRDAALYVGTDTPLTDATPQAYVVLRSPADDTVEYEPMTFVAGTANLVHDRLVAGSVRVYAKRASDGADVVENTDYVVDYERGKIYKSTAWLPTSINQVNYHWLAEVQPFSRTGVTTTTVTARVTQIALWALDTLVDRKVLSNNFGALIGSDEDSSESYRAFLRGIFQLYILGPVFERIESAINIILGFPVIRDDGEILDGTDLTSSTLVNYVFTRRTAGSQRVTYEFPKQAPLRADLLVPTNIGVLTFDSFEPLTTAITVTDYIQDPTWWHNITIPTELFTKDSGLAATTARRRVNAAYVNHVYNPDDGARYGDPGLRYGADEGGFQPPAGHVIYRHRLAFVLMDRYLKFHTFFVKFDSSIFSLPLGATYDRTISELNNLVFSAKPSHTYIYVQPATEFLDTAEIAEEHYYQPQRFVGGHEDQEIYDTEGELPDPLQPHVLLGVFLNLTLGPQSDLQRDRVLFADNELAYGVNAWHYGDYFRYEIAPLSMDFPVLGVPVAIGGAPSAPRHRKIVYLLVDGTITVGSVVRRLEENTDYSYDELTETITRLTAWDTNTGVSVKVLQLNIVNATDGAAPDAGDTPLAYASTDPGTQRANYSGAIDWFGLPIPVTDARDLSLVDRALQITVRAPAPFSLIEPYRLLGFFT